jgi:hypothetical protein
VRRLVLGLVVLVAASPVRATVLADWNLDDLVQRADLIVVGKVGAQRSVHVQQAGHGDTLMTETTIAVERTLLGRSGPSFVLSQLGGREGDRIVEIVGDAVLNPGDRVLLFTYQHSDGRRYLVGMSLGAYLAGGTTFDQQIDVPQIRPDGALLPPPGRRAITEAVVRSAIGRSGKK